MKNISTKNDNLYMFHSYPDVVHVDELREMLGGIGRTTAYALLKSGRIESVKMGRVYLIPKINVIRFLCESEK